MAEETTTSTDFEGLTVPAASAGELLAAIGYLADMTSGGCHYHAWRVALVSQYVAASIAPDIRRDVFYAGLLHDIGAVGAPHHITHYGSVEGQMAEAHIVSHPLRGAGMVNWLPGMEYSAVMVTAHHEWWNGRGYPERRAGVDIPMGALILNLVSAADTLGCFRSLSSIRAWLPTMSASVGKAWPNEVWAALVRSTEDAEFYRAVTTEAQLSRLVADTLLELPPPDELDDDEGCQRILHLFAALVDLKDPSTSGHSLRTAQRAEALSRFMGLPDDAVRLAYRAGLVHDCGRLGVDASILNKSRRLTESEMAVVREHAAMTTRALSCLPDSPGMAALGYIAGHDHERFDGTGYPDCLAQDRIPLVSRILCVCDAFDSMVSPAEYRMLTPRGAILRVQQGAGTQFDPEVVDKAIAAFNSGVLHERRNLATRPKEFRPAA